MIDFRYHLVSIVAVFLALGIGVLMGSAVLGENIVANLESQLKTIRATNEDHRQTILDLEQQISFDDEFANEVQPILIEGALTGREIVILSIEGTSGGFADDITALIEEAGGEVASVITTRDRVSLEDETTIDQLALLLGSSSSDADEMRAELGTELGDRIGKAVRGAVGVEGLGNVDPRDVLQEFVTQLEDGGYIDVAVADGGELVPEDAAVLVLAGSDADPPFRINEYVRTLSTSIAAHDVAVVLAEPDRSIWAAVQMIRSDEEARALVTTVDQATVTAGETAAILSLEESTQGVRGRHYGVGSGAESILPEPIPSG